MIATLRPSAHSGKSLAESITAPAAAPGEFLLTGVVSVSRVNDAKDVVCGRLLLLVPVLVEEPGGAAPLPQFGEDFSLHNAKRSRRRMG